MCISKKILYAALSIFLISACATPAYKEVFKDKPAYNSKIFSLNRDTLYQAALRAMCARNFIIEKEEPEKGFILSKRSFQRGKRTITLLLQATVNFDAAERSTLFLNALETTERYFIADRTRFFLWLVPLPGGGGKEGSSVKEGERVIEDKTFYQNFFVEIEAEAKNLEQAKILRKEEKETAVPESEKSAVLETPQELISQGNLSQAAPAEVGVNQTSSQNNLSQESVLQEIPVKKEMLPIEGNIANSSESGKF